MLNATVAIVATVELELSPVPKVREFDVRDFGDGLASSGAAIDLPAAGLVERTRAFVPLEDPQCRFGVTVFAKYLTRKREKPASEATSPGIGMQVDCLDLSQVRACVWVTRGSDRAGSHHSSAELADESVGVDQREALIPALL